MDSRQFIEYGIESEVVADIRLLQRGDQIAVEGRVRGGDYCHHGIYLGNGKVADFEGDGKKGAKPRIVSIDAFTDNGQRKIERMNYISGRCLSSEESARNAEKLVDNPDLWGPFNLLLNNCEHFATRCKTGIATSIQVTEKIKECYNNPRKLIKYVLVLANEGSRSASGFTSS